MVSQSQFTSAELLQGPALQPPDGIIPTLTRQYAPEQATFFICVAFCTVVSGVFVLLRCYTKIRVVKQWDIDDSFLILGFLLFLALEALGRVTLGYGMGVHQWNVTLSDFFKLLYWVNIFQIVFAPCCLCIKLAIVLQYLRLFSPVRTLNKFMFIGGWVTIALNFGFYFARLFVAIFACTPREKIWNKLYVGGSCVDDAWHNFTAYFNLISDLMILLLPVKSVWQLTIPRRKKWGICALFASGLVANAATALRIYYGYQAVHTGDWTFNLAWDGLWTYAELSLGIIITCAISLKRLWKEKIQKELKSAAHIPTSASKSGIVSEEFLATFSSAPSTQRSESAHIAALQTPASKEQKWNIPGPNPLGKNDQSNVILREEDWTATLRGLA